MNWNTVRRMRLRRHSLVRRSPSPNLVEVVSGVCGIHAVSGYGERSAGGTGQIPVLVVDGKVAGVWAPQRRGRHMVVRVEPFVRLNRLLQRQLETEAQRVGAVTDMPTALEIGPVEVRAHL